MGVTKAIFEGKWRSWQRIFHYIYKKGPSRRVQGDKYPWISVVNCKQPS